MNFTFDGNEWFMVLTSAAAFIAILAVRKHFRPVTLMIIWLFGIVYVETIDYALGGTPFKLYYCADNFTYEPAAAVIHVFLYPSFMFVFLYGYDKLKLQGSGSKLVAYYILWTIIAVTFEWVNLLTGVFTYTGWKLYYSIPTYPISAFALLKLYHFIERYFPAQPRPALRPRED